MKSDLAYPGPVPDRVKELLMPCAKLVAYEIGQGTKQMGILVTDEVMEMISLAILGASSMAAHAVMHERETLLADPTVRAWADTPNTEVSGGEPLTQQQSPAATRHPLN